MHHRLTRHQQRKLEAAFARADREAALRKQDGRCKYCLSDLTYRNVTRDHVIARATGGLNHKENIVACCSRCNKLKGAMPVKQFIRMINFPQSGEPMAFRMTWFDLRLNRALIQMERNVFKATGRYR